MFCASITLVVKLFYTPLLREHAGKTCIEGSNPSVSARSSAKKRLLGAFLFSADLVDVGWNGCAAALSAHLEGFLVEAQARLPQGFDSLM